MIRLSLSLNLGSVDSFTGCPENNKFRRERKKKRKKVRALQRFRSFCYRNSLAEYPPWAYISESITVFSNWRIFHDFETTLGHGFQIKNKEKTNIYSMRLNKVIRVGGTNQFGTNTCHHNKKLD